MREILIHPILTYGNEALRAKAIPIIDINEKILALAENMLETMYASNGVGLAAEQVGRTESICVIDIPPKLEKPECREQNAAIKMPLVLINPQIIATEGEQRDEEGCLSFPQIGVQVTRAFRITALYTDLLGMRQTITAYGLLARALQHELDHLNGVLLIDQMNSVQKLAVAGKLKRLQKLNGAL
ncbi:MAG: peptide deformylase [Kiritimatiellae bacterium]|nr:peptide deformylase [Kiritimatiellia bacterium]